MRDVIYEMSSKQLGMTCVVDGEGALLGIITDGDLRRQMERISDVLALAAADVMTRGPVTVSRATLAVEALNIMEQRKITSIVVVDDGSHHVAGVVHVHDLWGTEMF
jgi:arabinose-5-phosphate isomerase